MQNSTRVLFNQYKDRLAQLNGVASSAELFTVAPAIQQKLEKRVQESSELLKKINFVQVDAQEGEKVGIGVSGTAASTTDTTVKDREAKDISALNSYRYRCEQVNFDIGIRYSKLDAWRHKPDFQVLLRDAVAKQKALDYVLMGFNGISRSATSSATKNPLLQDVAVGWLQKYRNEATDRTMAEGAQGSGKIIIAKDGSGDYKNIDALVYDSVEHLIHPVFADSTDLVVLCGRGLLFDKYFPVINDADRNTEVAAGQLLLSSKSVGELKAYRVPSFPKGTMFITTFDNLAIYMQKGTSRRQVIDNPRRDRIEDFQSANIDFVIENYEAGCLIENIEYKK